MSIQNGDVHPAQADLPIIKGTKFKAQDFRCQCGCGLGYSSMQPSTIRKLLDARSLAGVPFKINSAIRCPAHNAEVRGRPNSAHLRGYAIDVAAPTSAIAFKILESLFEVGVQRIGYNSKHKFIHFDTDPSLPQEVFFDY